MVENFVVETMRIAGYANKVLLVQFKVIIGWLIVFLLWCISLISSLDLDCYMYDVQFFNYKFSLPIKLY